MINNDRLISLHKKSVEDYNCVKDKSYLFTPDTIKTNKWGQFYENYLYLASNEEAGAFNKKKNYFTNFIDKNKFNIDEIKPKNKLKQKIEENHERLICDRFERSRLRINENEKKVDLDSNIEKQIEIPDKFSMKLDKRNVLSRVRNNKSLMTVKKAKEIIDKNCLEKIRSLYLQN